MAAKKILRLIMLVFITTLSISVQAETLLSNIEEQSITAQIKDQNNITTSLVVTPEQCVALLQGQECYLSVEINWLASQLGDYCIYSSQREAPLNCWSNQLSGKFKQEFVAISNIEFFLREKNNHEALATALVKMAWVHKKKGKPRMSWRMF